MYEGMKVIHAGQLTGSFMVKMSVRQGCLVSPFLFLLVIDWTVKTTQETEEMVSGGHTGAIWKTLTSR